MRVHVGTDHAGFEFKEELVTYLKKKGYEVIDHGATTYDALDDYPAPCITCAEATATDKGSLGIVIGGSGNGEQIAANKVRGVRAALAWNEDTARLAREHNNANIVSIGARMHSADEAEQIIETFLQTPFSESERHQRRVNQMGEYELLDSPEEREHWRSSHQGH